LKHKKIEINKSIIFQIQSSICSS